jgi:hypothetical protein
MGFNLINLNNKIPNGLKNEKSTNDTFKNNNKNRDS